MERTLLSDEELLRRLNDMLSAHEECTGCRYNEIDAHTPDEIGCNWSPGPLQCSGEGDLKLCLPITGWILAEAREKYNLK